MIAKYVLDNSCTDKVLFMVIYWIVAIIITIISAKLLRREEKKDWYSIGLIFSMAGLLLEEVIYGSFSIIPLIEGIILSSIILFLGIILSKAKK